MAREIEESSYYKMLRIQFLKNLNTSKNLRKREKLRIENGLGRILGSGADGYVFEFGSERAIKYSHGEGHGNWELVRRTVGKLKRIGSDSVMKVYDCRLLGEKSFYVEMERLEKLTNNERERLDPNVLLMLRGKLKELPDERVSKLAKGLKRLKASTKLVCGDFHMGNVMKDRSNRFKLVDLESFFYKADRY